MAKKRQKTKNKDEEKKKKKAPAKKKDKKNKKSKKDKTKAPKTSKRKKKISPEERIEMIRTAAYYLAEKRDLHGSYELDDWIEAEKQIDTITD